MARKQNLLSSRRQVILEDSSIGSKIAWIAKYDPDKSLFKNDGYLFIKRLFDIAVVVISLPVALPLMLLLILMVKYEYPERNVFFRQLRTGQGGNRFWMYIFRTMIPNADELKPLLVHLNVLEWPDFKIPDDPRMTTLGKILRKTSLDELPQLLNVLKGGMSLVGPRPTSFSPDTYKLWQTERLEVTPGLTGLWQITSRGKTGFEKRLMLDIAYIQHRCMLLDIEILFRTVGAIFKGKGTT
ncbi:MAG: sugar transferase [Pelolinea sp.]|nr:sugar transferase [Pelolinea sp.]